MKKYFASLVFVFVIFFSPLKANAQESSGQFGGGSVIIGYDNQTCVGGLSGAMRYNSSAGIEFCDGSAWTNAGGVCPAPSSCSNIGDTCADGSQFAGFMVYGTSCEPLFVTDVTQSTAIVWSTATGDTGADSMEDGKVNQADIVANQTLSNFPAFELCENLSRHSQTDWYLPARDELYLLQNNNVAIGSFNATDYWSSTESTNSAAWNQHFGTAAQNSYGKTGNSLDVRCIRRD